MDPSMLGAQGGPDKNPVLPPPYSLDAMSNPTYSANGAAGSQNPAFVSEETKRPLGDGAESAMGAVGDTHDYETVAMGEDADHPHNYQPLQAGLEGRQTTHSDKEPLAD